MLILLSPAKNLDFEPSPADIAATDPALGAQARKLVARARELSRDDLKTLMGISDDLADLNFKRFKSFKLRGAAEGSKQAALAFNGDVFQGLDAKTLNAEDLTFAQDHLRILSGLYGVLRPLDAIQPYRLEMGSRLSTDRGVTLYDFWGDMIAKELNKALRAQGADEVVNLASNEYFGAVDVKKLKARVVTPVFKEEKDGRLKSLMFYAKRARGSMARWAITERAASPDDLKNFDVGGYAFRADASDDATWVFTRPQPATKAEQAA